MKVFVISLEGSVERRARMSAMLHQCGLDFEFFAAVNGRALDHKTFLASDALLDLLPGEVGCYLSHLAVWRKVVDDGIDQALVLEDDAILDPQAVPVVHACANLPERWDAIRLSSTEKQVGLVVRVINGKFRLILPLKNPSGLVGYLISGSGARRMLAVYDRIRVPIDTAVDDYWRNGLNIPLISPPVVFHCWEGESTIGHEAAGDRVVRRKFFSRIYGSVRKKVKVALLVRRFWGRGFGRWIFYA